MTEHVAKRIRTSWAVVKGGSANNAYVSVNEINSEQCAPKESVHDSKEKGKVKKEVKEDDLQFARLAAMHHRGVTRGETHR